MINMQIDGRLIFPSRFTSSAAPIFEGCNYSFCRDKIRIEGARAVNLLLYL